MTVRKHFTHIPSSENPGTNIFENQQNNGSFYPALIFISYSKEYLGAIIDTDKLSIGTYEMNHL